MDEKKYTFCVVVDTRATHVRVKQGKIILHSMMFTPSGVELTLALVEHLKSTYGILISRLLAEKLILDIGAAYSDFAEQTTEVKGRDARTDLVSIKKIALKTSDIQIAIQPHIDVIVNTIRLNIRNIVPELLYSQLEEEGISLEGDYAYLNGLQQRLQEALALNVKIYRYWSLDD